MHSLSPSETARMAELLRDRPSRVPHVRHCFEQMIRFANEVALHPQDTSAFNSLQFGLNLGRVQELLEATTMVDDWWRVYRPLVENKQFAEIISQVKHYQDSLGL